MAESALAVDFNTLRRSIGRSMSLGRSYYDGTVTVASGVVTLAGATWMSVADDLRLEVGGSRYTVNTRDSDTQITLNDLAVNADPGTAYVLHPWDDDALTDLDDILDRGLRQFYNPPPLQIGQPNHRWSFLYPLTFMETIAAYETGTITISSGVVTGIGTVFPADSGNRELTVNGLTYTVASYTNGGTITLDDLSLDQATAVSYVLTYPYYDMPDDFEGFEGRLTYRPGSTSYYPPISIVEENDVRISRSRYDATGRPVLATLRPKAFDATAGTQWQIQFYPAADAVYQLWHVYRVKQEDLDITNKYPLGGPVHSETILASVLAAAEMELEDHRGEKWAHFKELLAGSIAHDQSANTPKRLGPDGSRHYHRGDEELMLNISPDLVTYNGYNIHGT